MASNVSKLKQQNAERAERKKQILEALKVLVAAEIAKDPNFNISNKFLVGALVAHPESFFGIKTYNSLMANFAQDLNFLREKLGLPPTNIGRPRVL